MGWGLNWLRVFFGLVDLLGEIRDVVCPAGFGSVLDEGLAGIESMPIAELPGDSGFALLGESLLAVAPKGTKRSCPTIRVSLRSTALVPSPLRGPAYKGHPWPFTPLAASMPLAPLRNDCARPPERGDWRCSLVSAMSRSGAVSTGLLDSTLRCEVKHRRSSAMIGAGSPRRRLDRMLPGFYLQ